MKINRIEIKDFQQFKDFTLDLTYPVGHPKAGEPLDKVCFIGQSGTGKTTILNMLSYMLSNNFYEKKLDDRDNIELDKELYTVYFDFFQNTDKVFHRVIRSINGSTRTIHKEEFNYKDTKFEELYLPSNDGRKLKNRIIYLQTGLENHILTVLGQIEEAKPLLHTSHEEVIREDEIRNAIYTFTTSLSLESNTVFKDFRYRLFLLQVLEKYDIAQRKVLANLFRQTLNKDAEKALKEVQKWRLENPNPRIEIDEKLRPILEKFNVKLDTDWADGGLKLKNLQDEEFELPFASTGTKQILLSALPLLLMETAHKVILFDEPERSLFPDIQRELIDFYVNIAPESQFFFATHSPLIASQFEPWEIIELKFDEKTGKVYQEDYVKKGMKRHKDNYRFYPKYMRWDSILTEIYDLDADGNEEREHALQELAQADEDIKYYKAKGDMEKVAELVKTYKALADKLLWKTNEND